MICFVAGSFILFQIDELGDTAKNVMLFLSFLFPFFLFEVLDATNDSSSFFLDVDNDDLTWDSIVSESNSSPLSIGASPNDDSVSVPDLDRIVSSRGRNGGALSTLKVPDTGACRFDILWLQVARKRVLSAFFYISALDWTAGQPEMPIDNFRENRYLSDGKILV